MNIQQLAQQIVRESEGLWDAAKIAEYFCCSPDHAKMRYMSQPSFPSKIRIPYDQRQSKALYEPTEVREWARKFKQVEGRPREL